MAEQTFELLKKLAEDDNKSVKRKSTPLTITNVWYLGSLFIFLFAIVLAVINHLLPEKNGQLGLASLLILLAGYIGVMVTPVIALLLNILNIKSFFLNPLAIIIDNAKSAYDLDKEVYQKLLEVPLDELKLIKLEMDSERTALIARITSIVGKIDKIGLFPGLIALILAHTKVLENESEWLTTLAYANAVLFIFGFYANYQSVKMGRYNTLLDLTIEKLSEKEE